MAKSGFYGATAVLLVVLQWAADSVCLRWSERKWVRFRIIIPFNSTFPFADRRGLMPLILTRFQSQSHKANKCDCEQKQTNNQWNVVLPSLSNTLTTPNIMNAIGFYLRKQNLLIELYKAVPETTDAFSKRLIAVIWVQVINQWITVTTIKVVTSAYSDVWGKPAC